MHKHGKPAKALEYRTGPAWAFQRALGQGAQGETFESWTDWHHKLFHGDWTESFRALMLVFRAVSQDRFLSSIADFKLALQSLKSAHQDKHMFQIYQNIWISDPYKGCGKIRV